MGLDQTKTFLKKHADKVPAGENVAGVIIAEAKGGAWRRGMRAAGPATDAIATVKQKRAEEGAASAQGEVAAWPASQAFWLVLTDKQLHVWEAVMATSKAGPGVASYPLDRVANINLDKKLLISKLNVAFKDGTSVELDVAKQKVKPFVEAIESRFPGN